jgi:hypothetical protein
MVGETFIDGQQREVWCDSKIPITDMNMYYSGTPAKAYGDQYTNAVSCLRVTATSHISTLVVVGDMCLLNALNSFQYFFICE